MEQRPTGMKLCAASGEAMSPGNVGRGCKEKGRRGGRWVGGRSQLCTDQCDLRTGCSTAFLEWLPIANWVLLKSVHYNKHFSSCQITMIFPTLATESWFHLLYDVSEEWQWGGEQSLISKHQAQHSPRFVAPPEDPRDFSLMPCLPASFKVDMPNGIWMMVQSSGTHRHP